MKKAARIVLAVVVSVLCIASAQAQETREQAIASMRKVDAKEMDSTYTKPAPFAQKLVDEALAKHPAVILLAVHASRPIIKILLSLPTSAASAKLAMRTTFVVFVQERATWKLARRVIISRTS